MCDMHKQLCQLLHILRCDRNFNVDDCLRRKVDAINDYFTLNGLSAAVVGLSGGVDSSLVAALLKRASQEPNSPISRVVGLIVPIRDPGSTGQDEAERLATVLADTLLIERWTVDMSKTTAEGLTALDLGRRLEAGPWDPMSTWTRGQMLSVMRTPVFYGAAATLQQEGYHSLVVGTTNRDEGSYIGFFGKASDAMVDLQPISDLHKSEVRKLAFQLGVPSEIISRTPTGDVYNGHSDEQMIGAPYDFLELYLMFRCLPFGRRASYLRKVTDQQALSEFYQWSAAIESLHTKNAHKYRVGSPAIHLDVYQRSVPGGWQ